jgi:4-amino-4-deoxy-L-arabinose transferase-like glycosyltransferase
MVGWLNALPAHLFPSDFGMRLLPITLYALSNYLLYRLAVRLYLHPWVGFWSLALLNSGVMFQLLSQSMLPDTPLMVFVLLAVHQTLTLRDHPSIKNWLLLGLILGLAGLSKYTAITLVISLLILAVAERHWQWFHPKHWGVAALVALVVITPVLYWNAMHDWISILYQLHHGTHNDNWEWLRVLQSQGAQLILYNPLLYLFGLFLMIRYSFDWRSTLSDAEKNHRLLALFALPTILLFALSSGYEVTLPHWTQLAWLLMTPTVAYWLMQLWSKKAIRFMTYLVGGLSVGLTFVLLSEIWTPWIPFPENKNPVQELHGWPQALQKAQKWQNRLAENGKRPPLFAANWTQASRIAWYGRPQPVYVTDNRFDQFDLWFGNPPAHSNGLIVVPSYESALKKLPPPPKTEMEKQFTEKTQKNAKIPSPAKANEAQKPGQFTTCQHLETFPVVKHQQLIVAYQFFYCQDFTPPQYDGWVRQLPHLSQWLGGRHE